MATAVYLFLIGFVCWIAISRSKASPALSANTFAPAGVVVDFAQRTIRVDGKAYPIEHVRSLRWEREWNRSFAYITLTDLARPVHRVRFSGKWNADAAQTFCARLENAISQAGGPTFR
jgi:hypothetical protein